MMGKILSTIFAMIVSTYVLCLIIFYFLHQEIRENVRRLDYEVAEIVATSGILDDKTYQYLSDQVSKFGDYEIKLKLEKQIKPGVYDTFFETLQTLDINHPVIINRRLQVGDRVSIYLEDRQPTLFGRLVNATILTYSPNRWIDSNIKCLKTAIVSKNAKDLAKGYDVIADIKNQLVDPDIAILVVTRLNPGGKYYGYSTHPYIGSSNPKYGDDPDEIGNTGINYIFDNGDFQRQTEYYPDHRIKCITYIQQ